MVVRATGCRVGCPSCGCHRSDRPSASAWHITERAGRQRKWSLLSLEIKDATDIEPAFKTVADARADGVLVTASADLFARGAYVAELAARSRLPTMYPLRAFVDAGGLMSYGPSLIDTWRHAAIYVDRILKGERPAELPVEQLGRLERRSADRTLKRAFLGQVLSAHKCLEKDRVDVESAVTGFTAAPLSLG
jgi:hypothetical protein